jgi:hypothetical protein
VGAAPVAEHGPLAIFEVDDAKSVAGALFAKHFNAVIPDFPRHFVRVDRARDPRSAIGYVHHTSLGEASLAGGLVVSALAFRRFDAATAAAVRREGGLAEWIMRTSCAAIEGADAVFAYMGDAKSIRVNLRVGFVPTAHRYLHVFWKRELPEERRRALVERVAAIGPF